MSKYEILKELITQWIDKEIEYMQIAKEVAGENSPGFNQALGAYNAYQTILSDIQELENEVEVS